MPKRFIRCMGSELEKKTVRNAAKRFDFIHCGQYGYKMLEKYAPELRAKAVVWFNPFAHHRYESKEGDIQPTPSAMGHDFMPLQWGSEGQTACAYSWSQSNWPMAFAQAIAKWRKLNPWPAILLDDWRQEHPWWETNGMKWQHYRETLAMPAQLDAITISNIKDGDFVNGPFRSTATRWWEMWGRSPWHTMEILRKAKRGDQVYCSTGRKADTIPLRAFASLRGWIIGLGLPDGESMTDEKGELRVWVP